VVAVLAAPAFAAINFTVVASPNVGTLHNELHSVAVVSATEMFAVGEYYNGTWDRGLILKGNGTTWTASTAPVPFASTHNQLNSVAMANATLGWAVGTYSKAKNSYNLVEKFTGTRWVLNSAANPTGITASEFNGIAVGTTHSVMAVGDAHTPTTPPHPVSYLYNGTSWRNIAMPNPGKISTHT
jgi:hypothetical protein